MALSSIGRPDPCRQSARPRASHEDGPRVCLAGAHLGPVAILAMGISNVLADALSMSVGEILSTRSYNKYVRAELAREEW